MKKTFIGLIGLVMVFTFHLSPFTLKAQDSILTVQVAEGVNVEMVWVKGGIFTMGSNEAPKGVKLNYEASRPEHKVTVANYYIGRFEVTQALWFAVMGENPSKFSSSDALMPVENISWDEAQRFTILLSQMTGRRFRLPTEAEWEYAARGGTKLPFAGCERGQLDKYCWYCVNSERKTHPVGHEGEHRVLRGGHYNSTSPACTVYDRSWYLPTMNQEYFGLRVVMEE